MRIINRGKNLGKRVIAGMLIMSMAFGMSGCGGGSKGTAAESTAAVNTEGSVSDAGEDSDVKNMTFGCEEGFFGDHSGHIMSAIKVGDYIAYLTSDDTATEGEAEMMTEPDPEAIATMFLEAGVTSGDMRLVGIASLVAAVFEIWVGAICVLFSNRVNRYRVLLCATSALLIVEAIYLIILILKKSFILSAAMRCVLWCLL